MVGRGRVAQGGGRRGDRPYDGCSEGREGIFVLGDAGKWKLQPKRIPLYKLFHYADKYVGIALEKLTWNHRLDYFLLFFGSLCAMAHGVTMPGISTTCFGLSFNSGRIFLHLWRSHQCIQRWSLEDQRRGVQIGVGFRVPWTWHNRCCLRYFHQCKRFLTIIRFGNSPVRSLHHNM